MYLKKVLLLVVVLFFGLAGLVNADIINIPDYWGDPDSLFVEWQDFNDGNGLVLNQYDSSNAVHPVTSYDPWGAGAGMPDYVFNGLDMFTFYMPNVVDGYPISELRIEVTWAGIYEPMITSVNAYDPNGIDSIQRLNHIIGSPVDPLATGYFYEDWMIAPNPDYEFINIYAGGADLTQVAMWSVSTPEPTTMFLLGSGLMAAAALRRRNRKR